MSVSAKELIQIMEDFENTDKSVICRNIDLIFNTYYQFKNRRGSKRTKIIGGITQSKDNTVMAWGNSSRPIRIPFLKFLYLARALDIPYQYMLSEDSTWLNDDMKENLRKRIAELEGVYGKD